MVLPRNDIHYSIIIFMVGCVPVSSRACSARVKTGHLFGSFSSEIQGTDVCVIFLNSGQLNMRATYAPRFAPTFSTVHWCRVLSFYLISTVIDRLFQYLCFYQCFFNIYGYPAMITAVLSFHAWFFCSQNNSYLVVYHTGEISSNGIR